MTFRENRIAGHGVHRFWLLLFLSFAFFLNTSVAFGRASQQARAPARGGRQGLVQLEAQQQRKQGNTFYADGDVDIHYGLVRLRADHAQYNSETGEARLNGHVRYDTDTQSLESTDGDYNFRSGQGTFHHVHGTVRAVR